MRRDLEGLLGDYRGAVIRACKASIDAGACGTASDYRRAEAAEREEEERYALLCTEIERLEKQAERGAYLDGALRSMQATLARLMGGE